MRNREILPLIILFLSLVGLDVQGAEIDLVSKGGITVSFEKTGDEEQIKDFKKDVLPAVEEILNSLATDLGISSAEGSKAKIFFYSPEEYNKRFPQTIDRRIPAFFDGKTIQARADNDVNFALKTTLRHELTHLMLDQNYGRRIPSWFHEGMAKYEERQISDDKIPNWNDYNTIYIAKQDGKFIPLEKLEGQGIFNRSHGTVTAGLAYTTAFVAVYELIQLSGMDTVRMFLKGLSKGNSVKDEFSAQFGMPLEKFSEQLTEIAKKKTS